MVCIAVRGEQRISSEETRRAGAQPIAKVPLAHCIWNALPRPMPVASASSSTGATRLPNEMRRDMFMARGKFVVFTRRSVLCWDNMGAGVAGRGTCARVGLAIGASPAMSMDGRGGTGGASIRTRGSSAPNMDDARLICRSFPGFFARTLLVGVVVPDLGFAAAESFGAASALADAAVFFAFSVEDEIVRAFLTFRARAFSSSSLEG